jgi:hypothetical protein
MEIEPELERKQPEPSFKKDDGMMYEFSVTCQEQPIQPALTISEAAEPPETEYHKHPSMRELARKFNHSTYTIWKELHSHNDDIDTLGYCQKCKRVNGSLVTTKLDLGKDRRR